MQDSAFIYFLAAYIYLVIFKYILLPTIEFNLTKILENMVYLYKYDNSINLNSTLIIGPILAVCQGLTVFLGPFLMRYVHPRMVIIFGSTIAFIGLFSSSFITNLYAFSFLYGAFYGWGLGIWYLVPLICCWEYFPNRKGLVSGIIIGGFGFGAFFFGYISYAIANPNNAQPTLEVEGGKIFAPDTPEADVAPKLIRINWAIWLGLVLLGLLLLNRKEEVRVNIHQIRGGRRNDRDTAELETLVTSKQEVVNASSNENQTQAQINIDQLIIHQHKGQFLVYFCYFNHSNIEHDVPFKTAMKDYRTWLVASFVAVSITQGTYVSYIFKNYGLQTINDDGFLTTVGTIGAVANGLSRSFWANLLDRFPTKYIFGSLFIIQIAIAFTMELIVKEKILYFKNYIEIYIIK